MIPVITDAFSKELRCTQYSEHDDSLNYLGIQTLGPMTCYLNDTNTTNTVLEYHSIRPEHSASFSVLGPRN